MAVNIYPAAGLKKWKKYWLSLGGGEVIYAQDSRMEAVKVLKIKTAGSTVIINRQGRIVYQDRSATTYEVLKEGVEKAL